MACSHAEGAGALELAPTVCCLRTVATVHPGGASSLMVTLPIVSFHVSKHVMQAGKRCLSASDVCRHIQPMEIIMSLPGPLTFTLVLTSPVHVALFSER